MYLCLLLLPISCHFLSKLFRRCWLLSARYFYIPLTPLSNFLFFTFRFFGKLPGRYVICCALPVRDFFRFRSIILNFGNLLSSFYFFQTRLGVTGPVEDPNLHLYVFLIYVYPEPWNIHFLQIGTILKVDFTNAD